MYVPYKDRERQRRAQRESKQRTRQKASAIRKAQRERLTEYVRAQKEKPCADCGGTFPVVCMDFDHVRGDKISNVCELANQCRPLVVIDAEIAKCDLVCANCHRIRTH